MQSVTVKGIRINCGRGIDWKSSMNLMDIIERTPVPEPWSEGEKIPWNDPEFSKRMLKYHLSQDHDMASRRFSIIDKHVKFIDSIVGGPTRLLDLGCGPGFYTSKFTSLGYTCKGIDFGPASIDYAKEQARKSGHDIEYVTEDIRTADYGDRFGLVTMVYGEFNVFKREDILAVLRKAYAALSDGGFFIAEPHTFEAVKSFGNSQSSWYSATSELFSDKPHLVLSEHIWVEDRCVTINRHIVIDATSGEVALHADAMQAYSNEEYRELLVEAGFNEVEFHASLTGDEVDLDENMTVIVARK